MATGVTKLANLIDPEVMADMISAKLPSKIKVSPIAKIDKTLEGVPGSTITVPAYEYIGDAEDVAEGVAMGVTQLTTTTKQVTIKKAGKAVALTDEALLSAYGDPMEETTRQIIKSFASKIDNDCMAELQKASLTYDGTAGIISYNGIVDAVDLFQEEDAVERVMFIHPKQVTQIRKDPDFLDNNKYPLNTRMTGAIGSIGGCTIVPSLKVKLDTDKYICPIVQIGSEEETDDTTPALTIYIKRDVMIEPDREGLEGQSYVIGNEHYGVALSNDSKVVLAKFKATPADTLSTKSSAKTK